ncbi:MAG TPA: hypothetical protein VK090_03120 [Paracoccaceae bacterium]|nr:hypothetical protein [Paracoccaceae bacterium]
MSGGQGKPAVARIWGIVFALMLIMMALLAGLLIRAAIPVFDWTASLRLIAPGTADHPTEGFLDGGRR